jgi:three-Cys-motif partner protein
MDDPYVGREQTEAKHFILRGYLQELAFKVLNHWDITYVDGFSGPWKSQTPDFRDTSFIIAIEVLQEAQRQILHRKGVRRKIRCFFAENDAATYKELVRAVAAHHRPDEGFEIMTFPGSFESAVPAINRLIGNSFPLIFIDPTGWTGFGFENIRSIFQSPKCEVVINYMYDHITRFVASPDRPTIISLEPIMGGPGWQDRLDKSLPLGLAAEKLFLEALKSAGDFRYVISTKIAKSTSDRPHFSLAYGTKSRQGLKAFRQIEYDALKSHARNRVKAKAKRAEEKSSTGDFFTHHEADVQEDAVDDIVASQEDLAKSNLLVVLAQHGSMNFAEVVDRLLQPYMLRETNVKDICVALAKSGRIVRTWGGGNRKPQDTDLIVLSATVND